MAISVDFAMDDGKKIAFFSLWALSLVFHWYDKTQAEIDIFFSLHTGLFRVFEDEAREGWMDGWNKEFVMSQKDKMETTRD